MVSLVLKSVSFFCQFYSPSVNEDPFLAQEGKKDLKIIRDKFREINFHIEKIIREEKRFSASSLNQEQIEQFKSWQALCEKVFLAFQLRIKKAISPLIKRKLFLQAAEVVAEYSSNMGVLKQEYYQREDEREKLISYLKASLTMYGCGLSLSQSFPDFSKAKMISDFYDNPRIKSLVRETFENLYNRTPLKAWVEKAVKLKPKELIPFSRCFRLFFFTAGYESYDKLQFSLQRHLVELAFKNLRSDSDAHYFALIRPLQSRVRELVPLAIRLGVDSGDWKKRASKYTSPLDAELIRLMHLPEIASYIRDIELEIQYYEVAYQIAYNALVLAPRQSGTMYDEIEHELSMMVHKDSVIFDRSVRIGIAELFKQMEGRCKRPKQYKILRHKYIYTSETIDAMREKMVREEEEALDINQKVLWAKTFAFLLFKHYSAPYAPEAKPSKFHKAFWIKLHHYRLGILPLENLGINRENASECLNLIKIFDQIIRFHNFSDLKIYYPHSTLEARLKALQLCPRIGTHEALLMTTNRRQFENLQHLTEAGNWISDRAGEWGKAVVNQYILAKSLSDRLKAPFPKGLIWGMRGPSGSGKSTYIAKKLASLLSGCPTESRLSLGLINPDRLKAFLKVFQKGVLLNAQIHEEGSHLTKRLLREMLGKIDKMPMNLILDMGLKTIDHVRAYLIEPSIRQGCGYRLTDFDVTLKNSLLRILARPVDGEDPCPVLEAIIEGFKEIRNHRRNIIKCISQDPNLYKYQLRRGNLKIAEKKTDTQFTIFDEKLFKDSLSYDERKIAKILDLKVTKELIQSAIKKRMIHERSKQMLDKWIGYSLGNAVKSHSLSNGLP